MTAFPCNEAQHEYRCVLTVHGFSASFSVHLRSTQVKYFAVMYTNFLLSAKTEGTPFARTNLVGVSRTSTTPVYRKDSEQHEYYLRFTGGTLLCSIFTRVCLLSANQSWTGLVVMATRWFLVQCLLVH